MNSKELKDKLLKMTEEKVKGFIGKVGGYNKDKGKSKIPKIVSDFSRHPERERLYCQVLDLPTEEEKMIQAANESAKVANRAVIIASISVLISFFALFKDIF